MIEDNDQINKLKSLSFRKLKGLIKEIKSQLPEDYQNRITYSKNFTLVLSSYCSNRCSYCYFNHTVKKEQDDDNVILLENDKFTSTILKAKQYNCIEALLMSGESPDCFNEVRNELLKINYKSFIEYVRFLCETLLKQNFLPHMNIGTLNFEDLKELKKFNASMGLMLESTNTKLCREGGVHQNSPGKIPERRIKHIEDAGKLKIPFTTGLLLGIGESINDRLKDLFIIKRINEKYGHIQEVIIQNFIQHQGILYNPKHLITIKETLRTAALAKIICGNEISIQVPPNLIKNYENLAIDLGIDDFGGISPFTKDYINPRHPWPQINFLKKICERKGFILKERYPIYEKFIAKTDYCPESIKKAINNIKLNGSDRK
jgi:7,8-didemethyl-8-hydroxy-5-deazariboflavin synthase CofG subunit